MEIIKNIIIPLISALIGGLFSVWVFNKGLNKKKQEERKNRIQNNFETEEYFFYNLKSILFFIDKQVDAISRTSQNTKNWFHKNLTLATFSELKMTELRELNFKTLFQILVIDRQGSNKDKMQDFINIKNCLHNIEDFLQKHKDENKKLHTDLNKYLDTWNHCLKRLIQLYNHYIFLKPNEDDSLMPILNKYIVVKQREIIKNGSDQNMEIFYNTIIIPFMDEMIAYKNSDDQRILPVIENLMECRKSYEQTKGLRYQRRKNILSSGRRLIQIKQLLNESMSSIEKREKRIE
ncbi:hypothetical protein [Tenacibaculum sp. Ill]|uniref:hypothetical protein n=1 Tax=Tenacibaculum sp. Ill TaxID=3445935 RepID=UPI003F78EA84